MAMTIGLLELIGALGVVSIPIPVEFCHDALFQTIHVDKVLVPSKVVCWKGGKL